MQKLANVFKEHNLKVTSQRLAIYHMLVNTKSHPSAEKIHKSLEINHPSMSLATVYKTLDTLKNTGLVQELNVGEGCFRYDANVNSHAHAICRVCNEVLDLHSVNVRNIIETTNEQKNFHVENVQLFLYGLCDNCK